MEDFFKSEGNTKSQNVQKGFTGERMHSYVYFHERCQILRYLSHPQVLLSIAAFSDFSQSILMSGIAQHPALWLVELVLIDPLRFVQAPEDGIPSFCCVSCTAQLVPPADLLKVHSISLSMSLMKNLKSTSPKTEPWGYHTLLTLTWT